MKCMLCFYIFFFLLFIIFSLVFHPAYLRPSQTAHKNLPPKTSPFPSQTVNSKKKVFE